MTDSIIDVYDAHDHTEQAVAALPGSGMPGTSIQRHIHDGDELTSERPGIVQVEQAGFSAALFRGNEPVEPLIPADSAEAGGTMVRLSLIPPERCEAALHALERFHPSDVRGRPAV